MDVEAAFWEERGEGAAATLGKFAKIGELLFYWRRRLIVAAA